MGTLTNCIAKMGKALDEQDRRDILTRYDAHTKDGMPASDAAELAIREIHQGLIENLNAVAQTAESLGIQMFVAEQVTVSDGDAPADPIDSAEPMRFAAEAMAILGEINEVYRAPEIPKSANTIEKAVRAGIPGATKTEKLDEIVKMGGVDPVAGSNTPEAAQPGAYYRVVGEARFRAATYLMPPNPSTGASGGEFTIKEYLPSETFPSGALEVDVSRLGTGNAGAMVYNAVAGLAAAKGMPFRADSAGLTTWGAIRRTVTMTNAAMRYGVQFVEPGERQLSPSREMKRVGIAPLQWEVRGVGKTVGRNEGGSERSKQNFANLLRAESQSVRQVIGDVLDQYGFDWQALRFTKNGEPVSFAAGSPEIEALVQRGVESFNAAGVAPDNPVASGGAARPQGASPPYGRASIARAVLVQSLVRAEGQGGRRAILDRLGALVAESRAGRDAGVESSVPRDLRNLWSQQPSKVENPVPTRQRALRILTRAWGPDIQALMAQGKLRLVSLAEAKALTNNAPGIETAKGWYVDGVAHVIYDNNTADEIAGTALHEAGVHLAAPRLLGAPLYDTLTNALVQQAQSGDADPRVARAFAAANQALVDANGNQIADADSIRHETLAYLTEFNPGHGTVRRLLDSFMAVLNAMGFDLRSLESDTDLTLRVMRDALRAEARGLTGSAMGYQGGNLLYSVPAEGGEDDERATARRVDAVVAAPRGAGRAGRDERRGGVGRRGASVGEVPTPERLAPLPGAPKVKGFHGPDPRLVEVAERYARANGIRLARQDQYVTADPERGARIAQAYDDMQHAPQDPKVRAAYEDLIRQTRAQYEALAAAGYKFWFIDVATPDGQAYSSSPWNAMRDIRANQSMGVFPTDNGFGTQQDFDPSTNPLLADTGLTWPWGSPDGPPHRVTANDLFRAVHDAFGHGLEGAGFRADGEENAWQAHARLFTGPALGALTSETRGQNSWLNFGPFGEANRTAKTEDTVFADQKTGLMPEWTWTEGRAGDMPGTALRDAGKNKWNLRFSQRVEAATKDPKFKKWSEGLPVVKAGSPYGGRPAVLEAYHGSTHGDIEIFKQVGNMEGFFGPGPYFTTTPEDASRNYAGIGADLASRIEQLAEEMAQNTSERELLEEYFDANPDVERPYSGELDDDEAYDLFQEYGTIAAYDAAKRQLVGKAGGVVYPVFIKTKNPASISRRQPTKISGAEQAKKWREAMQRIDKEMFNGQMADVIDSIMEDVEPYVDMSGGVPHHDVYDMMRLRVPYLSTEEGQPISPAAVFRYVAEAAGHDAVVMDAGSTFNFMPGLTPNTVHVVPFVSEHIKSALGNKKYSLKEKRFMFSQRTPGQKELLRKTGMPIDDRGLITRSVDAVRREWQRMQDSWYGGTDARIQWTADRFRGIGAAEEEIERRIGRKLDANERSYVMSRMNLGLPSIMDAVLQYGAPRFEDQTWTQWADVTFPDGSSIEVYEQAPNRRAAMDALAMKYSGAAISLKRKPTTPVPGAPDRTGNTGSTTGVFVRNEDTKGLIDALRPVADDLNGWLAWMVVQRAKKLKAEGRENLLTDADIKAGDALADTPEKKRAFEKAAEDYTKIKEAILDVAEQAGTISREAREAWDHAEYIPFFRQDVDKDDVIGPRLRKRMTDTRPGIRVLKGGEQVLADPMGNIVRNFAKLLDSSMKNVALERLVTNLSLNVEDADAIRARLATFTKNVKPAQIQRAFAKVGLYDPTTGQFTQGKTEFSRSDLREALRSVGIGSEQINKAMGTADADSVFFQKVNMEVTRALVPMSAVIQSLLDDGVPQTVIDAMPPAALKGMREMMAFKMPQAPDAFTVMREGKATVYRANDPLLVRSLAGMQPRERGALLRFFSAPARFVTGMITRDPVFMVRNLTRDVLQNWTIAEVNYNPIISTVNGVARSMMETGGAIDMMFAGASFHRGHAQVHDPDATANAIRRVLRSKGMTRQQIDTTVERVTQSIVDFGRDGLEKWDRVGSAVENATREAVYEAAIRAGMSRAEANYMARDVMDFGLRGDSSLINTLADVLPFFNARIQGLYKLYRAGAIPGMGPKMRAAVMGRAMMLVGFSAGLMAMNLALFAEGYDELEEWDKDTYWHLAPGTAAHVRIPKPFEIGLLFGTIPERMLRAIQNQMTEGESGDAPKATLLSAWGGIWNTLGMNPIPQAILPAFEVWMLNRSMFTGRPIENLGDQKQPKSDVGEWYTSPIADKVAEAINAPLEGLGLGPRVGVSAKQIEHLWRGYTGTIGAYALSAADMIVNRLSDSPVAADDFTDWALSVAPADIPFIPGRSTRPIAEILSDGNLADGGTPRNYRQSAEFYALYDQVTVVAAGIKAQMERAQKAYDEGELDLAEQAEAEAMRRYEANAGLLGPMEEATTKSGLADKRVKGGVRFENQTAMNQAVKALRDTRDEIELVMTNPELSAVEQKRRVEEISVRRKQVIDEMLQKIRESKVQTAKEDE